MAGLSIPAPPVHSPPNGSTLHAGLGSRKDPPQLHGWLDLHLPVSDYKTLLEQLSEHNQSVASPDHEFFRKIMLPGRLKQ